MYTLAPPLSQWSLTSNARAQPRNCTALCYLRNLISYGLFRKSLPLLRVPKRNRLQMRGNRGLHTCVFSLEGTLSKFHCFYLWVLHPVAHLSNWFLMMPSIGTKFQYVNCPFFIFPSYLLHVSAPTGHPQARYTIRCFQGLFFLQRIRCTYTTWCMPILVLRPVVPNTCYQT
jgi:hypothetical protein